MTGASQPGRRTLKTDKQRAVARKRAVERGLIQFRAPEELVDQLLQLAEHKRISVSALVRSWVGEHVAEEMPDVPLRKLRLPNGMVLNRDSYANDLEWALAQYEAGSLKLTARERRTLKIWLLDQNVDPPEKKNRANKNR